MSASELYSFTASANDPHLLLDRCDKCVRTLAAPWVIEEYGGAAVCRYWCPRCRYAWWTSWSLEALGIESLGAGGGAR